MDATNQAVITAGPGAPPPSAGPLTGPSAGPLAGPSAGPPPAAAPSSPTQDAFAALGVAEPAPVAPPPAAAPTLNYIESGDGYYYILKEDNTFDAQPYIKQADGSYLPFQ